MCYYLGPAPLLRFSTNQGPGSKVRPPCTPWLPQSGMLTSRSHIITSFCQAQTRGTGHRLIQLPGGILFSLHTRLSTAPSTSVYFEPTRYHVRPLPTWLYPLRLSPVPALYVRFLARVRTRSPTYANPGPPANATYTRGHRSPVFHPGGYEILHGHSSQLFSPPIDVTASNRGATFMPLGH